MNVRLINTLHHKGIQMFSYDDLIIFSKVIQNEGIVKAAKKLNMNYTTVSRRLKQLEDHFKQPLLAADRHKFILTEFGKKLYQLIEDDVKLMEVVKTKIANEMSPTKEPHGVMNVQLPMMVSLNMFTPYLHEFLLQYPNIDLHLWYQNQDVDLIKENFDVVILNHNTYFTWQKSRVIHRSKLKLFCTQIYADKYGIPTSPDELTNHIVAGGIIGGKFVKETTFINIQTGEEITIPMPKRIATNNTAHNLVLLKSNEMIVSAFDDIVKHVPDIKLVPVLTDYQILEVKLYLLKNPYKNSVNIESFCSFIESCLNR